MNKHRYRLRSLSENALTAVYNTEMQRDFQPDERKPLSMILEALAHGEYEAYGIYAAASQEENAERVGYAFFVRLPGVRLLDYFAVSPQLRGTGIGSDFIRMLAEDGDETECLLLETEDPEQIPDETAARRLRFYLRNGCTDTGVRSELWGVPYQVLLVSGKPEHAAEEYTRIYRHNLPPHLFETRVRIRETGKKNPWEEIDLETYEKHMSLDSVMQLQTMNQIMKSQFSAYPAETAMILGVAGGNGLEHLRGCAFRTVYGIDINAAYLRAVSERYADLSGILQCMRMDLINEVPLLPNAQLLIANLLIEYIGCSAFQNAVKKVSPEYVSCVIQINTDAREWVSDSPYLHAFDRLDTVHRQMNEAGLNTAMAQIGYTNALQQSFPLPNGKALLRLDYIKKNTGAASE